MTYRLLPLLFALLACEDAAPGASDAQRIALLDAAPAPDAAPVDAAPLDAMADAAPPACPAVLADRDWTPPTVWATPIDDYIAAGAEAHPDDPFLRGVHDLAAFDGHLWIGYGDATYNLGRVVPIQLRGFTDPDDPTAVISELDSGEEHLDGFRRFGDTLLLPGIDATQDAWLGNVYLRRAGAPWRMARTVERGVHVHDVAQWRGALYAVGSGATPEEWGEGDVYGLLWISEDDADSWTPIHQAHNLRQGDSRLVHLLPVEDALYAFGYRTDRTGTIIALHAGRHDGEAWADLPDGHPLRAVFVTKTHPIDPARGLARGVDVSTEPFRDTLWAIGPDGAATRVETYAGQTVVDMDRDPVSGDWIVLTRAGDAWGQSPETWQAQVWIGPDPAAATAVMQFEADAPLLSVAAWHGALYFGDDRGRVLRAVGCR